MSGWLRLGDPPPGTLRRTRVQLHWAAQPLSSFGEAFVEHRADYRQRAMAWSSSLHALVTWGRTPSGHRLCLDPAAFRMALLDTRDAPVAALDLVDQTLAGVYAWLSQATSSAGTLGREVPALGTEKLPDAPVRQGAPFDGGDAAARAELARWFANSASALSAVVATSDAATPVLAWPHHFDIATLVTVKDDPDPEIASSVGLGMAPGDDAYPDPYFYVTPWPYPTEAILPPLPVGQWHTEGWVGAILPAESLIKAPQADRQNGLTEAFLSGSLQACRRLLS